MREKEMEIGPGREGRKRGRKSGKNEVGEKKTGQYVFLFIYLTYYIYYLVGARNHASPGQILMIK